MKGQRCRTRKKSRLAQYVAASKASLATSYIVSSFLQLQSASLLTLAFFGYCCNPIVQIELRKTEEQLQTAQQRLRSLNDASRLLTTAEVNRATSQYKLDQARARVLLCREELQSALEAEAKLAEEVRQCDRTVASVKSTWQELGDEEDDDDDCVDSMASKEDIGEQRVYASNGIRHMSIDHPTRVSRKGAEEVVNAASDQESDLDELSSRGSFVSVLTPSSYTPNPQGCYRSPLTALRVYVVIWQKGAYMFGPMPYVYPPWALGLFTTAFCVRLMLIACFFCGLSVPLLPLRVNSLGIHPELGVLCD